MKGSVQELGRNKRSVPESSFKAGPEGLRWSMTNFPCLAWVPRACFNGKILLIFHGFLNWHAKLIAICHNKNVCPCRYYDLVEGTGDVAREGQGVAVHFEAKWKGVTFITSRCVNGNMICSQSLSTADLMDIIYIASLKRGQSSALQLSEPLHTDVKMALGCICRQGMGVTGGTPLGFDIGADSRGGQTLKGLDLVSL